MRPEVFNRRTPGVTETEAKIIKGILDGAAIGALALFSSGSSLRRIGESATSAPLPVGKIFELFR